MPAYFDLSLQFRREDLYPGFMADFSAHLARSGLEAVSGYWEDEGLSQAEITAWNQKKLEANFCLGMTEHRSHDYKQTLYRFRDYREVRGFWLNQYPEDGVFTYFILIPEGEVLTREGSSLFLPERAAELLELARKLWQFPAVRAIQTELELSDGLAGLGALWAGEPPCVQPFAILEEDCRPSAGEIQAAALTQGRPGRLLRGPHSIKLEI